MELPRLDGSDCFLDISETPNDELVPPSAELKPCLSEDSLGRVSHQDASHETHSEVGGGKAGVGSLKSF